MFKCDFSAIRHFEPRVSVGWSVFLSCKAFNSFLLPFGVLCLENLTPNGVVRNKMAHQEWKKTTISRFVQSLTK